MCSAEWKVLGRSFMGGKWYILIYGSAILSDWRLGASLSTNAHLFIYTFVWPLRYFYLIYELFTIFIKCKYVNFHKLYIFHVLRVNTKNKGYFPAPIWPRYDKMMIFIVTSLIILANEVYSIFKEISKFSRSIDSAGFVYHLVQVLQK